MEVGEIIQQKRSHDLVETYLSAAARAIQNNYQYKGPQTPMFERQDIIMSIISSFLSLEAAINRIYYDVFFDDEKEVAIKDIPSNMIDFVRTNWRRFSVKDKFLLLPSMVSDFDFKKYINLFRLFEELITFRNMLVHSSVLESTLTMEVTDVGFGVSTSQIIQLDYGNNSPFKLSKFSFTYEKLTLVDAEKAFEITFRILKALKNNRLGNRPYVFCLYEDGQKFLDDESIEKLLIKGHFSELLSSGQET